ncbi:MAG: ribbon-helix-helix protein, CopG family [Candidatus Limnocylindrales bacterium]
MRTTVRLDDDVVAAVERIRRDAGMGLSEALNHLARSGMVERPSPRAFKQRTVRLGLRIDVSDVADAIETLEGPSAR